MRRHTQRRAADDIWPVGARGRIARLQYRRRDAHLQPIESPADLYSARVPGGGLNTGRFRWRRCSRVWSPPNNRSRGRCNCRMRSFLRDAGRGYRLAASKSSTTATTPIPPAWRPRCRDWQANRRVGRWRSSERCANSAQIARRSTATGAALRAHHRMVCVARACARFGTRCPCGQAAQKADSRRAAAVGADRRRAGAWRRRVDQRLESRVLDARLRRPFFGCTHGAFAAPLMPKRSHSLVIVRDRDRGDSALANVPLPTG